MKSKMLMVIASTCLLLCAGTAFGSSPTTKSEMHEMCYTPSASAELVVVLNSFEVTCFDFVQYNVAVVPATGSAKVKETGIAFMFNEYVAPPPLALDFRLCTSPYNYNKIGTPKTKYHADHLFHPLKLC